ncbi:MAG: GAF domain-containing protein, partial [Candidatus Thorarchaeota archaeon]|nr:GAF domain-containing protein [Candidatus Thorarchaeota archaeon]
MGKLTSIDEVAELTVDAMTDSLELELCAFLLNQDEVFQIIYEKGLEESIRRRETALKYFRSYAPSQSWREANNLEFLSELQIPIDVDGKVVVILIAKSIQPDKYTEQDKKLLEILASHVATAIQRIKLLEEQLQYEQRLEALHASAARLVKSNSIDDICKVTYEIIRGIFNYEWVGIGFVKDKTIRFPYATGNVQTLDSSIWYSLSETPIEFSYNIDTDNTVITRAVKTGETQDLPDTRLDPAYKSAGLVEGGVPVLKSEYAIPIIHSGEVIAVLNAESTKLDAFSEQDKKLLETLANNISAVLMRLNVAEERERIQQELALEHIRVEQANELDRLKNQFISTATHELRTPVTSIIGFLELVLDYSSEELPESVRKDLNVV